MNALTALLLSLLCFCLPAHAQDDERQQAAESSFDTVMLQNQVKKLDALGYAGSPAAATPARGVRAALHDTTTSESPGEPGDGEVEVPLARYEAVRAQIAAARAAAAPGYTTLVVLGASEYTGRAVAGGLSLHLQLQATLRGPGFWKAVPLVGEEVAVTRATVGGVSIALTNQSGYQVWMTDQVGEVTLDLDLLVPARGPRGSIEYDFLVARTPVTRFDCTFADAGLEPRLRGAVRSDVTAAGGGTRLAAWLEPTSRIHLVGFKDLGEEEGRAAKVYVEALSLLSLQESQADLFSVLKYTILQSGTRQFDILAPPGFSVISAEGAGAFRYTLEPGAEGTVIHGETSFPIRDGYEVSLRLARTLDGTPLDVVPPRAIGVERDHGWLGVEVLGAVQLAELERAEALSVDVGGLPAELLGNAVSPVLAGWRYHTAGARVRLSATRLPEREPAAGSIDEVTATTTLTPEGRAQTTLHIRLRNRLRHSLALRLPEGAEVRGCQLDGEATTPSRGADGAVLLALKRSAGTDRPVPFTLEVALEGDVGALGPAGLATLALPTFELPVSSLSWELRAPAANRYTRLYGDISPQREVTPTRLDGDQRVLRYDRSWVGAEQQVAVQFGYLRGWLAAPLALLGALALAFGAAAAGQRWTYLTAPARMRTGGGLAVGVFALGWFGGTFAVAIAAAGAFVASGLHRRIGPGFAAVRGAAGAPTDAEPRAGSWRAASWAGRGVLLVWSGFAALFVLIVLARVLVVLQNPLG